MAERGSQVDVEALKRFVRDIPDFPTPGILFRDITPLLADHEAFRQSVDAMAAPFRGVNEVVAIESRGFILGAPVAYVLKAGLTPVRKIGRLPFTTLREEYALEYGANAVEIHSDAIVPGERVLIVDDLLATGGTVRAAVNLVERLGATVAGISVLAELADLGGRTRLAEYDVRSLIVY
ncbi:MAG: adenine phosphoribosyltransferase [Thermomicrobiales bacterium]